MNGSAGDPRRHLSSCLAASTLAGAVAAAVHILMLAALFVVVGFEVRLIAAVTGSRASGTVADFVVATAPIPLLTLLVSIGVGWLLAGFPGARFRSGLVGLLAGAIGYGAGWAIFALSS